MHHILIVSPREVKMILPPRIEIFYMRIELGLREFAQVLGLFHTYLSTRVSLLTLDIGMRSVVEIAFRDNSLNYICHSLGIL